MDGEDVETTYEGEIDAFLLRFPATEALFWIPEGRASAQKMGLRYAAEIDHPSINWADEFEFRGAIPED